MLNEKAKEIVRQYLSACLHFRGFCRERIDSISELLESFGFSRQEVEAYCMKVLKQLAEKDSKGRQKYTITLNIKRIDSVCTSLEGLELCLILKEAEIIKADQTEPAGTKCKKA